MNSGHDMEKTDDGTVSIYGRNQLARAFLYSGPRGIDEGRVAPPTQHVATNNVSSTVTVTTPISNQSNHNSGYLAEEGVNEPASGYTITADDGFGAIPISPQGVTSVYEGEIASSITVLTIGDPHFKTSNARESEEMVDKVLQLIKERKPDLVIGLGDTLDTHEKIHVGPLTRATKFFETIAAMQRERGDIFVNIIGNHDRPNNSDFMSGLHPFVAMHEWTNTYVADTSIDINVKGYRFICVPYVPPGRFNEALTHVHDWRNNTCAIFAHQEFRDAQMGAIKSQVGDIWPADHPLVITGHVHEYQQLAPNLIYTGTPMQHAFGDPDTKTISIYTFTTDTGASASYADGTIMETNGSSNNNDTFYYHEERVDLGLTKKVTVRLSPNEVFNWQPPEGKLVRLVIRGTPDELKAIIKYEGLKELKKLGVKIAYKPLKVEGDDPNNPNHRLAAMGEASSDIVKQSYLQSLYKRIEDDAGVREQYLACLGTAGQTGVFTLNLV